MSEGFCKLACGRKVSTGSTVCDGCYKDRAVPCVTCERPCAPWDEGQCRDCYRQSTVKCDGCLRLTRDLRGVCKKCLDKGYQQCRNCDKWRRNIRQGLCNECVKVVDHECYHDPITLYKGRCVECFATRHHIIEDGYDTVNGVGTCKVCGVVSIRVRTSGKSAECRVWSTFRERGLKYGIGPEGLVSLYLENNARCFICDTPEQPDVAHSVDHDHSCCEGLKSCGKCVKHLLCSVCNQVLGMMNDDPERLRDAAAYLEDTRGFDQEA